MKTSSGRQRKFGLGLNKRTFARISGNEEDAPISVLVTPQAGNKPGDEPSQRRGPKKGRFGYDREIA
jgi:hypothetical protein